VTPPQRTVWPFDANPSGLVRAGRDGSIGRAIPLAVGTGGTSRFKGGGHLAYAGRSRALSRKGELAAGDRPAGEAYGGFSSATVSPRISLLPV
jgi:hypothetical protein